MTNPASPANLIFHNGQVLTMDPASTIVSAVAVSGESIQAVGNDALPLAGPGNEGCRFEREDAHPWDHRHSRPLGHGGFEGDVLDISRLPFNRRHS